MTMTVTGPIDGAGRPVAAEDTPHVGTPPAFAAQPSATADLDALTTQVIRRIERRAIAQREHMGGG